MSQGDLSALSASMPRASEYKCCELMGYKCCKLMTDLMMMVTLHRLKGASA